MTSSPTQHASGYIPSRRRFIRTTAGGLIVAATSASLIGCESLSDSPASASEAWRTDIADTPILRWGLSFGILAPNPHNLQPWLVDISNPEEMLIAIDPDRLLPETDPYGRQILIGTGAMLGVFELAVATKGYSTETSWIGPGEASSDTQVKTGMAIVRVKIKKDPNLKPTAASTLFDQVRARRTVRASYDLARVPDPVLGSGLKELSTRDQSIGLITREQHGDRAEKIAEMVKDAWNIELSTPNTSLESMKLLRIGRREINKHRDGIAIESTFLYLMNKLGMVNRREPIEPGSANFERQISSFNAAVDSTPGWLYLSSEGNNRMDQINVGRTYVMAQLKATELGMVMHPLSQGLQEYKEMSDLKKRIAREVSDHSAQSGHTVQMLARIGYLPAGVATPKPAPRRGLDAHIVAQGF